MGIVSIGEVVGSVSGGPSEQEAPTQAQAQPQGQQGGPGPEQAEALERLLRAKAWRKTRLSAD